MQKKIEKVVDDPKVGIMLTYKGEPLIIISPVNHAGWRKLSCITPDNSNTIEYLDEIQRYVTEELNLYRNNKMENWRWNEEEIQEEDGIVSLWSINLRGILGEEE
jgi:hypothetical protein